MMTMLEASDLQVRYGPVVALDNVSVKMDGGEIVAIVGANGVGKTTLMRTLAGLLQPVAGTITFAGRDVTRLGSHHLIRQGITLVPEGRHLFADLTVDENLRLGAFHWRRKAHRGEIDSELAKVYALFPDLLRRKTQLAGTLSGGQQQMVAVGRGLMSRPTCLLLDEPSLGLAPLVIRQIFRTLVSLRDTSGLSIILVEQDAEAALRIADRGYVMQRARVVLSGTGAELRANKLTREIYFGGLAQI
ncbi:ABC transporter ATP-binding protein [Acidisoma cellulosilyticum]|nr:ABC transporter ATP-binding protein [Acidisoma cellulosilyticum]